MSVGSIHNIQHTHLPNVMLGHRVRSWLMIRTIENSYMLEGTRGRVGTTVDAAKGVHIDFEVQVSANTIKHALYRRLKLWVHMWRSRSFIFRKKYHLKTL